MEDLALALSQPVTFIFQTGLQELGQEPWSRDIVTRPQHDKRTALVHQLWPGRMKPWKKMHLGYSDFTAHKLHSNWMLQLLKLE